MFRDSHFCFAMGLNIISFFFFFTLYTNSFFFFFFLVTLVTLFIQPSNLVDSDFVRHKDRW